MKFGSWDRRLVPVIGAVLVVVSAAYGHVRLAEEEQNISRQRSATMAETTRSRSAQAALAADRNYLMERRELGQAMAASGFLDDQDRLAVSQAIEALGIRHRLNRLRISFAPEEVSGDRFTLGDSAMIVSTPVSMTLDAAREDDLYGFLDDLPAQFSGVAMIESASIRRGAGGSVTKAKLVIRWQTVRGIADDAAVADARQ
ncbi:MAG: hypothetical protein VCC99_17105 [Alphaproteobacteria bacterium]